MDSIKIGDSGMMASRIALGTWAIGGWMWGGTDIRSALGTIRTAIDGGITVIDTASAVRRKSSVARCAPADAATAW